MSPRRKRKSPEQPVKAETQAPEQPIKAEAQDPLAAEWMARREATIEGYRKQIHAETGIDPGSDPTCRPETLSWLLASFCDAVAMDPTLQDYPPSKALIFYLAEYCRSELPLQHDEEMRVGSLVNSMIVVGHWTQGRAYKEVAAFTGKNVGAVRMNHKRFLKRLAGARDPLVRWRGGEKDP